MTNEIARPVPFEHQLNDEQIIELLQDRLRKIFSEFAQAGIQVCLVGSMGRAASLDQPLENLHTFGLMKDIDLFIFPHAHQDIESILSRVVDIASPFSIDVHFARKITFDETSAEIHYKDIALAVDPIVFEVKSGDLYGVEVPTFDPLTLFHLTSLYGPMRPNDWKVLLKFLRSIRASAFETLPDFYFQPFHQLAKERYMRYPLDNFLGSVRWHYHRRVSFENRQKLNSMITPVRSVVEAHLGWIESPHA